MDNKLVEKIATELADFNGGLVFKELEKRRQSFYREFALTLIKFALSDPSICEIEVGAELPRNPYCIYQIYSPRYQIIERYKKKLAGWVKKKDGG